MGADGGWGTAKPHGREGQRNHRMVSLNPGRAASVPPPHICAHPRPSVVNPTAWLRLRRWNVDSNLEGKRVRRLFSSKAAAQTYLADLRLQQREAGEVWMSLPPKEQTELLMFREELNRLGVSLSVARDLLPRLAAHAHTSVTLDTAITECLAWKETAGRRPKYVERLSGMLTRFAEGREKQAISAISSQDIETWINQPGSSAGSRATYLSRVNTLFSSRRPTGPAATLPAHLLRERCRPHRDSGPRPRGPRRWAAWLDR